jgi:hypothetical protein
MIGRARKKRRGVRTRHGSRTTIRVLSGPAFGELLRSLDMVLIEKPCVQCGAPSVAEHFDFATDRVVTLCHEHKMAAVRKDCE